MDPKARIQGVIDAILGGEASAATRDALAAVPTTNPRQHLSDLVAIALGSSDFQRR
jgi:hypothetical protein